MPAFFEAFKLQQKTVQRFYQLACELSGKGCPLGDIPVGMLDPGRNFFSTFFLGVTRLLVDSEKYMPLYAMVNQSMRAWVTACDNILDDEYKTIFEFNIPGQGNRMRSVLTLMLAERVLVKFTAEEFKDFELLKLVQEKSFHALIPSALQECEEEGEKIDILASEVLLRDVHQRKTADLFAATLLLPIHLEKPSEMRVMHAKSGLENFGMACQVIDDIKDLDRDIKMNRHNLVAAIFVENGGSPDLLFNIKNLISWKHLPEADAKARKLSDGYFRKAFCAMEKLGLTLNEHFCDAVIDLIYQLLRVPRVK